MMRDIIPKKDREMTDMPRVSSDEPIYPGLNIELQHLPEAKDWEVGKEYDLSMKVKMTGLSVSKFQNSADFEITEIDPEQEEDEKDENDPEDKKEIDE